MHVHLIYHPNRDGAEVRVHKAGCRDIGHDIRFGCGATSDYTTEVTTEHEAAEDFYADFIDEGSMTAADAWNYVLFLPCTAGLPEGEPSEPDSGDANPVGYDYQPGQMSDLAAGR